jgi:hypothetical protein
MRGSRSSLALGAVLLGAAACTNFQDPTTVVDLRVLAVQTQPSEIILSVDVSDPMNPIVDPASNPPVTVTPLIVDPAGGGRPVTYSIIGCPNDPFAPAPPGPAGGGAFPAGGARTTVGSQLCDETSPNTWTLAAGPIAAGQSAVVQPTADMLKTAFLTDLFPDQFSHLHGGFDLGEPFVLEIKIDTGGELLNVVKRVLYWAQPVDALQVANNNPTIADLTTYAERDPDTALPIGPITTLPTDVPFFTPPAFTVPAGSSPWIQPAPGDAEPYETTIVDDTTHLTVPLHVDRETLRYAFYATAGTFAPARTASELPPGFTGTIHLESQYAAPTDLGALPVDPISGGGLVTIWVVVRDDRGGESWITRQLAIVPATM